MPITALLQTYARRIRELRRANASSYDARRYFVDCCFCRNRLGREIRVRKERQV